MNAVPHQVAPEAHSITYLRLIQAEELVQGALLSLNRAYTVRHQVSGAQKLLKGRPGLQTTHHSMYQEILKRELPSTYLQRLHSS